MIYTDLMTRTKKTLIVIGVIILALIAATAIYINDYYHAEEAAQLCITEPADSIGVTETEDGNIIFAPSDPQAGMIFYPGGKVEAESYAPLMTALAERNVLAVLVSMPGNLAVLDIDAAAGVQEQFPEIESWYMAGHSLGGSMAASYLGDNKQNFDGLILLASYSTEDLSRTDLAVLSIYGDKDGVLDMEKYSENKANLPAGYEEVVIEGGCHAYFGSYGPQDGDGEPTISPEEQVKMTADAIEAFILGDDNE